MDVQTKAKRNFQCCSRCRERKVKCDGVEPTCGACARRSTPCSWVANWRFKDQNGVLKKKYIVIGAVPRPEPRRWETLHIVEHHPELDDGDEHEQEAPTSDSSNPDILPPQILFPSSKRPRLPATVNPACSIRLQMLAVALRYYLPSDEQTRQCESIEQWPTLNFLTFRNASLFVAKPLVTAAVDAFSLVQAAVSLSDPRLAFASIRHYNACISGLRNVLITRTNYTRCDILLCMLLLIEMETMRPVAQVGGYLLHIHGVVQFLASEGPRCLVDGYENILFQRVRQASILLAFAQRKSSPFGTDKWIAVSNTAPTFSSETRLLDIGVTIPALAAGGHCGTQDSQLFSRLSTAKQALQCWIAAYQRERTIVSRPFHAASFSDFAQLVAFDLEGQAISSNCFNDAFYLSLALTLLFVVQLVQFSILVNSSEPSSLTRTEVETGLAKNATLLCSAIPQFFNKNWGFTARTSVNVFLRLLDHYYQSIEHETMMKFCLAVKRALGRPELGHSMVTDDQKLAFEHHMSALRIVVRAAELYVTPGSDVEDLT